MDKRKTLIGALAYMEEVDPNGTWDEAAEELQHGTDALDSEITYMIDVLTDWKSEIEDSDKDNEIIKHWIERLKIINE